MESTRYGVLPYPRILQIKFRTDRGPLERRELAGAGFLFPNQDQGFSQCRQGLS